jgi:transketolase
MCTGALGHGLAIAVGMALGARIQKLPFHTFVMLGDGELHEGSNWEAAMAAAHYRLANLTAIVDHNKIAQSGRVDEIVGLGALADKWRAFGWAVREIDGHDMADVVGALEALPLDPERPTALVAHTVKGKGVSFAEDTYLWHSNNVNDEVLARALAELTEP